MAKKIRGLEVIAEYLEWGTEVTVAGEPVVVEADDEEAARLECVILSGKLKARQVFETAWCDVSAA